MTQMISKTQAPVKRAGRIDPIAFFERFGVLIFMILLLIFFQSQNSNFFSERNIFNILTEVSIYGIMAVGMTFVILTAGIDLSVGSILAVCAMTAAYVIKGDNFTTVDPNAWGGMSWLIGLGICLAVGTAIAGTTLRCASASPRAPAWSACGCARAGAGRSPPSPPRGRKAQATWRSSIRACACRRTGSIVSCAAWVRIRATAS